MPYKDPEVRKAKQKEYSARHYQRNAAEVKERNKAFKARKYVWWREYKAGLGCFGCDENDPNCLEFHHVIADGKTDKNDSANRWVYHQGWSKEKIIAEIEKTCVPLCSNCHRKVHAMAKELDLKSES